MSAVPVHACTCAQCRSRQPHPERAYHQQINFFLSQLNELQRRWFVALEALHLGYGGRRVMSQITGLSPMTIRRGCRELQAGLATAPEQGLRARGGGRPIREAQDPDGLKALERLLAGEKAGDPMGRRHKAKRGSLRALSAQLTAAGHPASRSLVAKWLRQLGYSPKANAKRTEARQIDPVQRNAQFRHITEQRAHFAMAGEPVIRVDTKKRTDRQFQECRPDAVPAPRRGAGA